MTDALPFRIVIPARYDSQRLPGKPLRELAGRPLLAHVLDVARAAGAQEVVVATDDERIAGACRRWGAGVEMTATTHASGTDRLAEVARRRGWAAADIVVNLQGDEPLMPAANLRQVADLLQREGDAHIGTLATPLHDRTELLDPNIVKVVCRRDGQALYFSRAPIPWDRDGGGCPAALRHVGLYAYRCAALLEIAALPPGRLEQIERLEQLRALENGLRIAVGIAAEIPGPGVDTEADLAAVARLLARTGGAA